jgi:hypothetical protein
MPPVPTIIRKLPFFDAPTTVVVQGRVVPVKSDQIIVWVSIAEGGQADVEAARPHFPAILDTGHSHNFSIQEQQLVQWAGLDPRSLTKLGEIRVGGDRLPLLEADVLLHTNEPGQRDVLVRRPPYCLELDSGIAVYPQTVAIAPRLPLLGLRAFRRAGFSLTIDCQVRRVTIRTPRRFWVF